MSNYCHLCDADPCYCGQHGQVTPEPAKKISNHGGPRGMEVAMRELVLTAHQEGIHESWGGWLQRLEEKFGPDASAVRATWNRVSNGIQRDWLLIEPPAGDGPMMPPSHYPHVRHLTTEEGVTEVERLIESGGWSAGDSGLRLWQVWRRIPDTAYIAIYDALHDMNARDYLVTTTKPGSANSSQFWYVRV